MRHFYTIFFLFILLLTCIRLTANPTLDNNSTHKAALNVRLLLDKLLPEVIAYAESSTDTTKLVFTDEVLKERFPDRSIIFEEWTGVLYETDSLDNDMLVVTIGNLVDSKNIFAAAYANPDSLFCFFRLNGREWKEVGRHNLSSYVAFFETEELNGKPGREILASTSYNMNLNKWSRIFCYFEDKDEIRFVGDLSTDYTANISDGTIYEDYAGSWYMDLNKTVYIWYNDMLVPLRSSVVVVSKDLDCSPDDSYLEYYENLKLEYDTELRLIFREKCDDDNPTVNYKKYWDNFFELGKSPLSTYKQE